MAHTPGDGDAARAARLYKEARSLDIAPKIRESKLEEAIRLWNGIPLQATLSKNLGLAHQMLAELSTRDGERDGEPVLSYKSRIYHRKQSIQYFTAGFRAGVEEDRPAVWTDELLARCSEAFTCLCALHRTSPLEDKLTLRLAVYALPERVQADAMIEVVRGIYQHGVSCLDSSLNEGALNSCKEAYKAFREVERPLCESDQLCRRADASVHTHAQLEQLRNEVALHANIAESRRAIQQGDVEIGRALLNAEALNVESVWTGLDLYQSAGVLTRGCDIETEAISLARRGRVYAKVLRNEALARPLLTQATTLATSLAPRSFYGVDWYDQCVRQLQAYQNESAAAEDRAEARRRAERLKSQAPTRAKLKAELDALEAFALANNAYKLLEHVYDKYEPKVEMYTKNAEAIKNKVKGANADTLKKVLRDALVHYHTDKNIEFGVEWLVRCEEVFKHLNGKYDRVKQE